MSATLTRAASRRKGEYLRDVHASWFGHIVPGTGTGGLAGWTGSARIVHDDQGAYFEINLD
jgi:Protein of unknown function (DUF3224)